MGRRAINITEQRFGKLIAKYPTNERRNGNVVWFCVCDCGNTTKVRSGHLRNDSIKSCGCIRHKALLERVRFFQEQRQSGMTFAAIGRLAGVSRQRIQQITARSSAE